MYVYSLFSGKLFRSQDGTEDSWDSFKCSIWITILDTNTQCILTGSCFDQSGRAELYWTFWAMVSTRIFVCEFPQLNIWSSLHHRNAIKFSIGDEPGDERFSSSSNSTSHISLHIGEKPFRWKLFYNRFCNSYGLGNLGCASQETFSWADPCVIRGSPA